MRRCLPTFTNSIAPSSSNFTKCGREQPIISAAFWVDTSVATGTIEIGFPSLIAFKISAKSRNALDGIFILVCVSSISISVSSVLIFDIATAKAE